MDAIKKWIGAHPNLWEFILFNVLSNCATVTNFIMMWLCTGVLFTSWKTTPFRFFVFDYTSPESLMLCGFLSFLLATALAQTVNFFVQKNLVFKSDATFEKAIPKYVIFAIFLVLVSAALPGYSQSLFIKMGISASLAPTLANIVNIVVQVLLSYPTMKFWIMPKTERSSNG